MNGTGNLEGKRAVAVPRYRLTDADGKEYAPFRLKPGIALHEVLSKAGPDLDVQVVGS